MNIRDVILSERPVLLAPMEDVTDASFRLLCKEQGADLTYTEFVSADALVRNISATTRKLEILPEERPTAIQIYGRDVDAMVEAAKIAETANPDILDINFGCPVKKIAGKGAGAGLLRDVPLLLNITRAIVKAVKVPVTVKTRLGWDHNSKNIVELAERLQDEGIEALTIHGRTRSQMYTGEADWSLIAAVKNNPRMRIPIIGNGDITTPEKAVDAFNRFGVDAIMVGRASIGAPWIFCDIKNALDRNIGPISKAEKFQLLRRQIIESVNRNDEYRGILHIRRHLAASPLFKGIPNFRANRIEMLRADKLNDLLNILDNIQKQFSEYIQ